MCNITDTTYEFTIMTNGTIKISVSGEKITTMTISANKAKINDSYLLDRDTISETVTYTESYCKRYNYSIARTHKELCGEVFLHKILYKLGYKRSSTKDCDLDFIADSRWYVNVASKIFGWIFF